MPRPLTLRRAIAVAASILLPEAAAAQNPSAATAQAPSAPTTAPAARSVASPNARVTLRLDSAGVSRFSARSFELTVGQGETAAPGASIELVKSAGPATGELVRLSGTATVAPEATIELFDSLAAPVMTLHLTRVTVVSDRVSLSNGRAALEQQRLAQQETYSSLSSEYQDAERQLSTLEELGKTRVATRQDIARARDRASDLKQRLDLLRQRQALLSRQLESVGSIEETVVLRFDHLEIEDAIAGTRTAVQVGGRPPGRSRF